MPYVIEYIDSEDEITAEIAMLAGDPQRGRRPRPGDARGRRRPVPAQLCHGRRRLVVRPDRHRLPADRVAIRLTTAADRPGSRPTVAKPDREFVVHNLGTRYFVTELTIRVLSEDQPFHGSLGDLVSAVTEGPCVGDLVSERNCTRSPRPPWPSWPPKPGPIPRSSTSSTPGHGRRPHPHRPHHRAPPPRHHPRHTAAATSSQQTGAPQMVTTLRPRPGTVIVADPDQPRVWSRRTSRPCATARLRRRRRGRLLRGQARRPDRGRGTGPPHRRGRRPTHPKPNRRPGRGNRDAAPGARHRVRRGR